MGASNSVSEDNDGDMTSSKKECTSCEQNNVNNITKGINNVAILDDVLCAACGKEGNSDDMNTCNKCKEAKYCNAACKKKHRSKHKKACEKRVAELHEEALFKEAEPEECPICMLTMLRANQTSVESCCGKRVCNGCIHAMHLSSGKDLCAFCRTPPAQSDEEDLRRVKKQIEFDNAEAFYQLAGYYSQGIKGMPQDYQKANELYLKAGELGCADGYYNLGISFENEFGVEADKNKAKHYYELAAMDGSIPARHNLGSLEHKAGNVERAMKHFVIAARAGLETSLNNVKVGYIKDGLIAKDEYANTLRAYQKRQLEMKSDERDRAAEFIAEFRLRRS